MRICAARWTDMPCAFGIKEMAHVCVRDRLHRGVHSCSCGNTMGANE